VRPSSRPLSSPAVCMAVWVLLLSSLFFLCQPYPSPWVFWPFFCVAPARGVTCFRSVFSQSPGVSPFGFNTTFLTSSTLVLRPLFPLAAAFFRSTVSDAARLLPFVPFFSGVIRSSVDYVTPETTFSFPPCRRFPLVSALAVLCVTFEFTFSSSALSQFYSVREYPLFDVRILPLPFVL